MKMKLLNLMINIFNNVLTADTMTSLIGLLIIAFFLVIYSLALKHNSLKAFMFSNSPKVESGLN